MAEIPVLPIIHLSINQFDFMVNLNGYQYECARIEEACSERICFAISTKTMTFGIDSYNSLEWALRIVSTTSLSTDATKIRRRTIEKGREKKNGCVRSVLLV